MVAVGVNGAAPGQIDRQAGARIEESGTGINQARMAIGNPILRRNIPPEAALCASRAEFGKDRTRKRHTEPRHAGR